MKLYFETRYNVIVVISCGKGCPAALCRNLPEE